MSHHHDCGLGGGHHGHHGHHGFGDGFGIGGFGGHHHHHHHRGADGFLDAVLVSSAVSGIFNAPRRDPYAEGRERQRRHEAEMAAQARRAEEARRKQERIERYLAEGNRLLTDRNYAGAIIQFKSALGESSQNPTATSLLQHAYELQGDDYLDRMMYADALSSYQSGHAPEGKIQSVLERVLGEAKIRSKKAQTLEDYQRVEALLVPFSGYPKIGKELENIRAKIKEEQRKVNVGKARALVQATNPQVTAFVQRWALTSVALRRKEDLQGTQAQLLTWDRAYQRASQWDPESGPTCAQQRRELDGILDGIKEQLAAIAIRELSAAMAEIERTLENYSIVNEEHLQPIIEQCDSWSSKKKALETVQGAISGDKAPIIERIRKLASEGKERLESFGQGIILLLANGKLSQDAKVVVTTAVKERLSIDELRRQLLSLTETGCTRLQEKWAEHIRPFVVLPKWCCGSECEISLRYRVPKLDEMEQWIKDVVRSDGQIPEIRELLVSQRLPAYNPYQYSPPPTYSE